MCMYTHMAIHICNNIVGLTRRQRDKLKHQKVIQILGVLPGDCEKQVDFPEVCNTLTLMDRRIQPVRKYI